MSPIGAANSPNLWRVGERRGKLSFIEISILMPCFRIAFSRKTNQKAHLQAGFFVANLRLRHAELEHPTEAELINQIAIRAKELAAEVVGDIRAG